ncbi:MAG: indole-3-glycerol phosphate synthase TrpC [Nanoarchaeota archaeon]|nr:indole-3-glycerol phosphate synthase TrpC [Nanoarchaeota archaeon]
MIVAHTREVVEARKKTTPLETLKRIISSGVGQVRSFKAALRKSHLTLIAEIKRASPSAGNIQEDADPLEVARAYASAGADAISVLTEERFFKGSLETLRSLRKEVSLPLLRKEFILDEYQVYESRAAGADAILLIVTLLTSEKLSSFITLAGSLGMDCLVECHTEAELKQALAAGADIIGINNRDLATFRIDSTVFSRLRPLIPEGKFVVCESGISSREDALRARNEGADAILVGTALMKAPDIAKKARELRGE